MVQIMAWRRPGDKPLSETMMVSSPTHTCVTRPQWVNLTPGKTWTLFCLQKLVKLAFFRACINNYIHVKQWHVITHTYPKFNDIWVKSCCSKVSCNNDKIIKSLSNFTLCNKSQPVKLSTLTSVGEFLRITVEFTRASPSLQLLTSTGSSRCNRFFDGFNKL